MVSALAIVCARNEAVHMRRCLTDLIGAGLEVRLIDNGSTDGTREIAERFLGCGLLAIDDLPWTGSFSLTDQLSAKRRIVEAVPHDWIVHADADEWLMSPVEGQSLSEGLSVADAAGATYVNFHELVFTPLPGENFWFEDYAQRMLTYYFFQPYYPRLNRAWRRLGDFTAAASGGHILEGEGLQRHSVDFLLRHYIVLSEAHACAKYVGRRFSDEDRAKGWHGNRLAISPEDLKLKPIPELRRLAHADARDFDLSRPITSHFWQW